jgi:hypothetical protein
MLHTIRVLLKEGLEPGMGAEEIGLPHLAHPWSERAMQLYRLSLNREDTAAKHVEGCN